MGSNQPVGMDRWNRGFLTEEEKTHSPKVSRKLLKRIGSYLQPYWKQMTLVLLSILLSSILGILPSILTGRIIDEGLIGQKLDVLIWLIVASLGVMLGSNLIGVL